jgi:hypothetical protein
MENNLAICGPIPLTASVIGLAFSRLGAPVLQAECLRTVGCASLATSHVNVWRNHLPQFPLPIGFHVEIKQASQAVVTTSIDPLAPRLSKHMDGQAREKTSPEITASHSDPVGKLGGS